MSAPEVIPAQEQEDLYLPAVLEAMLFASPEPLTLDEIRVALPELDQDAAEAALDALSRGLSRAGRGLALEKVGGGYRLTTKPELAGPLQTLFRFRNQKRLSPAALDVLSIVAYAQPITGPEIHEIRGTDPAYALRTLLDRRLVRIVGRKRVIGRPILYGTTREFLLHFGLDSLQDLPPVEGFGTRVAPTQGRLFPATDSDVEPLDEQLPAAISEEDAGERAGEDVPDPTLVLADPPPPAPQPEVD